MYYSCFHNTQKHNLKDFIQLSPPPPTHDLKIFEVYVCISILWLPQMWWLTTTMYSLHHPRGQKFEIKVLSGPHFLQFSGGENPFLASSSFQWLLALLGLWPHLSLLYLHMVFSVCAFSSSVSNLPLPLFTMTLAIGFRAHQNNLGLSHFKIFNRICKDLLPK